MKTVNLRRPENSQAPAGRVQTHTPKLGLKLSKCKGSLGFGGALWDETQYLVVASYFATFCCSRLVPKFLL